MHSVPFENMSDCISLVGQSYRARLHLLRLDFVQLSQKAAGPVWMRSTDSVRLFRTLD